MNKITRREAIQLAAIGTVSSVSLPADVQRSAAAIDEGKPAKSARRAAGTLRELRIGSVQPQGWLRLQLEKQADGITGHLTRLYPPFTGTAWTADATDPKTVKWPWEQRGYWCDGAMRCGLLLKRDSLIEQANQLVQFTFGHPQPDGYLGPSFLKPEGEFHRWPHAVFFRAAMAWHDGSQDPKIVEALHRHYLNSSYKYIGERDQTNIEAMLWTYDRTGDPKLLALAEQTWALYQNRLSEKNPASGLTEKSMLAPGPVVNMHGCTYAEHTKLPALLYRATGNPRYLDLAVSANQKVFNHHLLVDGGPSSSETLSTTTARDGHETCDLSDYCWNWGYVMAATGAGIYGDRIERIMFNALPGAIRKDWKALQYFSSPNQFLCTSHSDQLGVTKGWTYTQIKESRFLQRKSYRPSPGYDIVCCPANLNRVLPNYIARMWMSDPEGNGVAATLYGPCSVTSRVGPQKTEVEIEEETRYPYSDEINFRFKLPHAVGFPLHLRIPAWCDAAKAFLDDREIELSTPVNGFATLHRIWKPGDVVRLKLPMVITTSEWPEDGIAIERGPLVFAYPIAEKWTVVPDELSSPDFPAWDLMPTGDWNFGLLPPTPSHKPVYAEESSDDDPWSNPRSSITVSARQVSNWELTKTTVNGEAATFIPRLPDAAVLPHQMEGPVKKLKLIPYASTELRLTIFPYLKANPDAKPGPVDESEVIVPPGRPW